MSWIGQRQNGANQKVRHRQREYGNDYCLGLFHIVTTLSDSNVVVNTGIRIRYNHFRHRDSGIQRWIPNSHNIRRICKDWREDAPDALEDHFVPSRPSILKVSRVAPTRSFAPRMNLNLDQFRKACQNLSCGFSRQYVENDSRAILFLVWLDGVMPTILHRRETVFIVLQPLRCQPRYRQPGEARCRLNHAL